MATITFVLPFDPIHSDMNTGIPITQNEKEIGRIIRIEKIDTKCLITAEINDDFIVDFHQPVSVSSNRCGT